MSKLYFLQAKSKVKKAYADAQVALNKNRFSNKFGNRVRDLVGFWKMYIYIQLAETFLKFFFLFQPKPTLYTLFDSNKAMVIISMGAYFFLMMPLFLVINSMDAYKTIMTLYAVDGSNEVDKSKLNEYQTALGCIITGLIVSRLGSNIVFLTADIVMLMFKFVFYKRTLEYTEYSSLR
ncbi:hypothetical protein MHC_01290 [Mycoplasma haemocanis str. Illinois]|uniref:Uncharacterized protein n=1 Tax=Mycoplasma haemocanis (strain Illinois) TaxID=1111676 RepID=H6N652_MYCHN|nr:hypothetical protein [Mycoplasma haemocanis]AEW45124.1 hypothetical protein MHC_01290 [Mycoplasma haemocanis str. Illinois]